MIIKIKNMIAILKWKKTYIFNNFIESYNDCM